MCAKMGQGGCEISMLPNKSYEAKVTMGWEDQTRLKKILSPNTASKTRRTRGAQVDSGMGGGSVGFQMVLRVSVV